jgi:lysophospholipase L1-like esterase
MGRTVEVLNGGLPAYTTHNHIGFCALWLPELDADVVVVHAGFNDAFAVAYPEEGGPAGEFFHRAFVHRPVPQPARAILRASHLARVLGIGWLRRNDFLAGALVRATMHPIPSRQEIAEQAHGATGRLYERNLKMIVRLIRLAGAEPVLSSHPMNPGLGQDTFHSATFVAARRNNAISEAVAAAEGAAFVDLYQAVRDPAGFVDPVHMNEAGMQAKADALYATVRDALRRRVIPPSR